MIYGITAFAGYEAATTLSEEARDAPHSVPRSIIGVVVVVGLFYLLVVTSEVYGVGRRGIPVCSIRPVRCGTWLANIGRPRSIG
jgi:amino acid transporter